MWTSPLIQTLDKLPIQPPPVLIGRDALLEQVTQVLYPAGAVLLYGALGVGRHALAASLAARHLKNGRQVLWLHGDTLDRLTYTIVQAYQLKAANEISNILGKNLPLVVLDCPPEIAAPFIWTYNHQQAPTLVIHETAADGPWEPLLVRRLDENASQQLFMQLAGTSDSPELTKLLKYLDGHPLSIRLAAKHIQQEVTELLHLLLILPPAAGNPQKRALTVIDVLFKLLDQGHQGLLMAITASFTPTISAALVDRMLGAPPNTAIKLAQTLIERGFIQRQDSTFSLHPLTQLFGQDQLHYNEKLEETQKRLLKALIAFAKDADEAALIPELAQLGKAMQLATRLDAALHQELRNVLSPFAPLFQKWGYATFPATPPDPATQADTNIRKPRGLEEMAATQLGVKTEVVVRDNLQIAYDEAVARRDRPEIARLANALGHQYIERDQPNTALQYFRTSIDGYQEIGDLVHVLETLEAAAIFSHLYAGVDEAQKYINRAMNIAQQLGDDTTRGRLLSVLGDIRSTSGDHNGAMEAYKQSIKLLRMLNDMLNTGITLGKLATLYMDRRRYREASVALSQAVGLFEQIKRRDLLGRALGNLGTALGYLERWQEAGQRHAAAMRIARDLGDTEEERFQLQNLAYVAEAEGYLKWAINYNRQALYLALQANDAPLIGDISFEIGRLLLNDPDGAAQAVILLEHAAQINPRAETVKLLNEARARVAKRERSGRGYPVPQSDLMRYAAEVYPLSR